MEKDSHKLVVISAPSGTGKSTLIKYLLEHCNQLEFSISVTSRKQRGIEQHGKDYYFITIEEFKDKIAQNEFVEYVEVYKDNFYGTLRSEIDRITNAGKAVLFDIDVEGALKIKKQYGSKALCIFIKPPSLDVLSQRLMARGTDTPEVIQTRIERAEYELTFEDKFDVVIVNDVLNVAEEDLLKSVTEFIK